MGKKGNPMKGKKKGGMGYILALLVAFAILLPASAPRSEAAGFTYGLDTIPTRVTAGYRLVSGPSDPGEAGSISLNNALSVINDSARLPGFVVKWKEERVLELGVLSGGYAGAAGADATTSDNGHAFLGVGGYVLEFLKADAIWVLDSNAASNYGVFVGVDVARLGPKLVSLTTAAWGKTGL